MAGLIDAFHMHLAAMDDMIEENDNLDEIAHEYTKIWIAANAVA